MNISPEPLFAALANDVRLRCLLLLQAEGELCVCELTHALETVQPKISRHLALLREAGWVQDRRQGLWVYYSLHPKLPSWACKVLDVTAAGIGRQSPYARDRARLARMARPSDRGCA